MAYEPGARSHLDRMNLTERLCELLRPLFEHHDISFCDYGQNVLITENPALIARLRKLDVKKSDVVCMVKFSPDFVLWKETPKTILMLDAKVSITPMFFDSAITSLKIKSRDSSLNRYRIAEVEREAWDNYTKRFPPKKVAICMAAPYHPRLLVAEWASDLKGLYRFEADLNEDADGSGTPHVNIDLGKMRSLDRFLSEEFQLKVDADLYQDALNIIKEWPLNKPGRVNWRQFNNVIVRLHHQCPWLRGRIPKEHVLRKLISSEFDAEGIELELFNSAY
jgi:hypothetical protein